MVIILEGGEMKKKIKAVKDKKVPVCQVTRLLNQKQVAQISLDKLDKKTKFGCSLSDVVVR
jgi:hypothetical protein